MKSPAILRELDELASAAVDRSGLDRLIELIEDDHSWDLYRAVSEAKIALSRDEVTRLKVSAGSIRIDEEVTRSDFERWVAPDIARIAESVEDAMTRAGVGVSGIDRVFLTGGSSYLPVIRRMFDERFGAQRVETGDQLVSIAAGLALIGEEDDLSTWTVSTPANRAA